jgi:hypothetical protein
MAALGIARAIAGLRHGKQTYARALILEGS